MTGKRKKGIVISAIAFTLAAAAGCQKTAVTEDTRTEAGITIYDEQDVFIRGMIREVFQMVQKEDGSFPDLELEMQDAKNDQTTQEDQIQRYISLQYDVLCVNLVDRTSASSVIDKARQENLPVIFFNRQPVQSDMELYDRAYYLGSDAEESARLQAEIVLDAWRENPGSIDANGDGVVSYVILEGQRGHQDTALRTEYSVRALEEGGMQLKKIEGGSANFERSKAEELMERWLKQDNFEVELVLANNDEMALGALEAIEKCGAKGIQVVGIDGTDDGKKAVQEGRMLGTVVSDQKLYAETLLKMIEAVGKGEDLTEKLEYTDGKYVWIPWEKYTG